MGTDSGRYALSLLPVETPDFETMNKVIELYVKNVNPTKISKELGVRRVDVLSYIDQWRASAAGSDVMQGRVEELITAMDQHYSILIQKAYEIIEEVDRPLDEDEKRKETMTRSQMLSQKKGALDLIAKLEKERIDIFQKSGLTEVDHLGDQIAQMEEEKAVINEILHEELCERCKPRVMSRIVSMMRRAKEAVVVVSE